VTRADFDEYCITTPADPRLPDGGGQRACGLFDISPARFGLNDNVIVPASTFGSQKEVFDGIDVVVNARLRGGLTFQGAPPPAGRGRIAALSWIARRNCGSATYGPRS
jgi:hypothetical protein